MKSEVVNSTKTKREEKISHLDLASEWEWRENGEPENADNGIGYLLSHKLLLIVVIFYISSVKINKVPSFLNC